VWRTVGGKQRYLLGEAQRLVPDDIAAFRAAAKAALRLSSSFDLSTLEAEHASLEKRLARFGDCSDTLEIWNRMGLPDVAQLPLLDNEAFLAVAATIQPGGGA